GICPDLLIDSLIMLAILNQMSWPNAARILSMARQSLFIRIRACCRLSTTLNINTFALVLDSGGGLNERQPQTIWQLSRSRYRCRVTTSCGTMAIPFQIRLYDECRSQTSFIHSFRSSVAPPMKKTLLSTNAQRARQS